MTIEAELDGGEPFRVVCAKDLGGGRVTLLITNPSVSLLMVGYGHDPQFFVDCVLGRAPA